MLKPVSRLQNLVSIFWNRYSVRMTRSEHSQASMAFSKRFLVMSEIFWLLFDLILRWWWTFEWPKRNSKGSRTYIWCICEISNSGQLIFVGMHQKLNCSFTDFQCRHVRQEIIAHKKAHKNCIQSKTSADKWLRGAGFELSTLPF